MSKRIEWVDVYKGFLITLVVLGHSLQEVYLSNNMDFTSDWLRNIIYSFHMPAFMAMSGYLVFSLNRKNNIGTIIKKRFKQLIIPLLIWTVAIAFVKKTSYLGLILYPNNGYWFLWALFFIIVIFNLIDLTCNKLHVKQEIGMLVAVIVLTITQTVVPNPKFLGYEYIAYYFPFYIMGYYANKYKDRLPRSIILICITFVLWFIMACFWTPNDLPVFLERITFVPSKLLQLSYRMIVPVIFVFAMYLLASRLKEYTNPIWRAFMYIGEISLGIYLVHMVMKRYMAKWLVDYFDSWPMGLHITIEFLTLITLSILIVKLLQKCEYSNRWLLGKF